MRSEIKAFFTGILIGYSCIIAIIFRRKKNTSNGIGIQCNNDPVTDGQNTIRRIQEESESRLDEIDRGLQESIELLQRARERSEKENNNL